jgi:ATP-dependent Clp protease ATP-binding subunit ClpA
MDHGKLTDHNGKKIDFSNVVLIMTTNAGAAESQKNAIGFGRAKREGEDEDAIKKLFTPEFRNRLDATIPFSSLPADVIANVVQKFVMQLDAQLADRNVTIELTPEANHWLATRGYDEQMGARPLARVIQESIKKPLADEVLFGRLTKGGHVKVKVGENDTLAFDIEEAPPRAAPPPRKKKGGDVGGKGGNGGGSTPKVPLLVE